MVTALVGDVDCSGGVDVLDALILLFHAASPLQSAACLDYGDVDCDGEIGVVDALLVLRHVAGLAPPALPAGCPSIGSAAAP